MIRILLVQEIEEDRTVITNALEQRGYQVAQSNSVSQTLSILGDPQAKIDVVLAALHLQEASSFDILRYMRQDSSSKNIPFIFCCFRPSQFTTTTADAVNFAARVLGAQDLLIQEEFDVDLLERSIQNALGPTVVQLIRQSGTTEEQQRNLAEG